MSSNEDAISIEKMKIVGVFRRYFRHFDLWNSEFLMSSSNFVLIVIKDTFTNS